MMQAQPYADLRAETSGGANYFLVAAGPTTREGIMAMRQLKDEESQRPIPITIANADLR